MRTLARAIFLMFIGMGPAWAAVIINTATQSELESVKCLGPSKAKAIIAYREKNGLFKSLDDLDKVKGFGKATIGKLKPELTVDTKKEVASAKAGERGASKTGK